MTHQEPIRVLIVDDSAFIRQAIRRVLSEEPNIEVVDTAVNGREGLEKIFRLRPNLVTLDLEMPEMDGFAVLRALRDAGLEVPVIVISSLTQEGAEATLEALALGAVDFIPKTHGPGATDIGRLRRELRTKIAHIASGYCGRTAMRVPGHTGGGAAKAPEFSAKSSERPEVVLIGASTGGPMALQRIFSAWHEPLPVPVVVVQHMPPLFTQSLAKRLDSVSALEVKEAENGDRLEPGRAYVGPGGRQMRLVRREGALYVHLHDEPYPSPFRPSVNMVASSIAVACGPRAIGVILTGMGDDGALGLKAMHDRGAFIIGQDEATSVIYGMPRAAFEIGAVDVQLPLEAIPQAVRKLLSHTPRTVAV
ncbi:MAG: chemotaxis response regulator protein-glutamate methylesterase [Bacteroidota bacterium]|nr:chemotaxis response regulator protein-glutamate methylesterase [Bacteroidota bacterium]MDW8137899.1 chemotaxis response regulator protein-glutamate methylesterase [Bacteroidota bacterium]